MAIRKYWAPALGEAHRRYSAVVNARMRVTGHLFQSRFGSVVMDEEHLMAAARYVALNPVRAGLAARVWDWRWSSARAHLAARDDALATAAPLLERCAFRFVGLIDAPASDESMAALRWAETSAARSARPPSWTVSSRSPGATRAAENGVGSRALIRDFVNCRRNSW